MKQNLEQSEIKYYTPSIEEFHVGFEYERYCNTVWNVYKYSPFRQDKLSTLYYKIIDKQIRVKYLDIDDILSLGFKEYDNGAYSKMWNADTGEVFNGLFEKDNLTLRFHSWYTKGRKNNEEYDEINKYILCDIRKEDRCIFRGLIKNKSELFNILKKVNYGSW